MSLIVVFVELVSSLMYMGGITIFVFGLSMYLDKTLMGLMLRRARSVHYQTIMRSRGKAENSEPI